MQISYHKKSFIRPLQMPGSKSITNRLLVLKHLYFSQMHIGNASTSSDSKALEKSLDDATRRIERFHIEDGGTSLRFLLCFLAIHNHKAFVSCGPVLFSRPHDELVATLNEIGFNVVKDEKGFAFSPVDLSSLNNSWNVDISKSSQFATALLLIAPSVNMPIDISLEGAPVSLGYFDLTIGLMQDLGFTVGRVGNVISVLPFEPIDKTIVATTESDWSSISYFVGISRLSNQPLTIQNVSPESLQPDKNILAFATLIGVESVFTDGNLELKPIKNFAYPKQIERNYINCPDIALTEIVVCQALGIELTASGTNHLKYKESNRLEIIKDELSKIKAEIPNFLAHSDHRVAMSLTCLSILKPIQLDDISVVSKSFPDFWQEVSKIGIYLTPTHG